MTPDEAYRARRKAAKADLKAALLARLRELQAAGAPVDLCELGRELGRSGNRLRALWHELDREGLARYPARERLQHGAPLRDDELEQRIAMVREAKLRRLERTGKLFLSEAELEEIFRCEY